MIHKLLSLYGKNVVLVESGDHAILAIYDELKRHGVKTVLIQDQGGWLTYKDYAKKTGLEIRLLPTDYGLLSPMDIPHSENAALMINSLTGYCAEQRMEAIAQACKKKNIVLINDASGSIGTDIAEVGDIVFASFGKDKPLNMRYGGFIAFPDTFHFSESFDAKRLPELKNHLLTLPARQMFLRDTAERIKKDLTDFKVIHRDKEGINVIVAFSTEQEKKEIISYCTSKGYPYTLCPRYIRVNANAISIEVKRLTSSSS